MNLRFKRINKRLFTKPVNKETIKVAESNRSNNNAMTILEVKKENDVIDSINPVSENVKEEKKTISNNNKKMVYAKKELEIKKEKNPITSIENEIIDEDIKNKEENV